MESQKEIKINETHLCVLRKIHDSELIEVAYEELKFPFESSLAELKRMSLNDNRNICELESYVLGSPLEPLTKYFSFCFNLSNPWEGLRDYSFTDFKIYNNGLKDFDNRIEKEQDPQIKIRIQNEKSQYIKSKRENVFHSIEKRRLPYMCKITYEKCQKDPSILAYSHRLVGFNFPEFNLGTDFTVIYKSNFGYGSASYFYTNIRYKGIDILPYSDWIRYRYADQFEIIRYTRRNYLQNKAWEETMHFTAEIYNFSIQDPSNFVDKWIMNECREMVEGLEYLLNNNKSYEVINSFYNRAEVTLMGIDLAEFKGERISGALTFLDKILTLKVFSPEIDYFIQRIMDCNLSIYPKLKEYIKFFQETIDKLTKELEEIMLVWNPLNKKMENYENFKESLSLEIRSNFNNLTDSEFRDLINEELIKKYPEYLLIKKSFDKTDNEKNATSSELNEFSSRKIRFEKYSSSIEDHFSAIGDSRLKIA